MIDPPELLDQVKAALPSVAGRSDEELVRTIWASFRDELTPAEFAGSSPRDTIIEWCRTEFARLCRKGGETGTQVWNYLKDAETQHDAERIAIVSGFLLAHFAKADVDLHALTALIVLLVRLGSRREPPKPE